MLPKFGLPPRPDDVTETAYQAHNQFGPKAWYKKAKALIFNKKDETDSSTSPSSGQDENVLKRLIVREHSDVKVLGEDEEKRVDARTASAISYITRFICGLSMVQVLHFLITYQATWDPIQAGVYFALIGFAVACGMAFSKGARSVAVLVLPILSTSSGRGILISYASMMILSGPMNNIAHNYGEMTRSMICGNELGFNVTHGLKSKVQEKQFEMLDVLDNTVDVILASVERAKAISSKISRAVESVGEALGSVNNYLNVGVAVCSKDSTSYICSLPGDIGRRIRKKMTRPLEVAIAKLRRMFYVTVDFDHAFEYNIKRSKTAAQIKDDIVKKVRDHFGYINDVMYWARFFTALSTIIVIVKAVRYRKKYLTRIDYDNIYITGLFKHLDRKSKKHGRLVCQPLRFRESKKYISPKRCWMSRAELKKCFRGWLFVTTNLVWALLMMGIDFTLYGSMKLLTMTFSMKTTSFFSDMVKAAKATSAGAGASHAFGAIFTLNIFGKGLAATIYRAIVHALQKTTRQYGFDINVDKCLPKPSVPDYYTYIVIGAILQTCYLLVYIQAYMLRLRRYIMSRYYPERERQRIVYLRKKILNNRGIGHVEDLRNTLRNAADTVQKNEAKSKFSCKARLIKWSNRRGIKGCIARFLTGRTRNVCSLCSFSGRKSDDNLFTTCQRPGCAVKYCKPCFDDLHRICPSCLMRHSREKKRIRRLSKILGIEPESSEMQETGEFGDIADDFESSSGISDSSDEERIRMKQASKERQEHMKNAAEAELGFGARETANNADGRSTVVNEQDNKKVGRTARVSDGASTSSFGAAPKKDSKKRKKSGERKLKASRSALKKSNSETRRLLEFDSDSDDIDLR